MAVHEPDRGCRTIVTKMLLRQPLTPEERSHLVLCAECMLEVVRQLDQRHQQEPLSHGTIRDGELTKALERSRAAFVREFGVS